MGFVMFMLGCFSVTVLICVFLICVFTRKKFKKKLILVPITLWVVGISIGVMFERDNSELSSTDDTQDRGISVEASSDGPRSTEETTQESKTPETETVEATEAQESEEEFKTSCQEISYKSLLRTPDDYIGQRIVLTAEVKQIMSGGWFDDNKYYRVQTDNDGRDWYIDDEYYMYDGRPEGSLKILEEDVIKIYAEFIGLEEVHRAITGASEEMPAIRARYIELISE